MFINTQIGTQTLDTRNGRYYTKGFVFVVVGDEETPIYNSPEARIAKRFPPVRVKGEGGYTLTQYELPEGSTLKLSTKGSDCTAIGYVRLNSSAPAIRVYGSQLKHRGAFIEGRLEIIKGTLYSQPATEVE